MESTLAAPKANDQGEASQRSGEASDSSTLYVRVLAGYYDMTPPAGERLTSISTSFSHTCGLRVDGTAVCWGSNQHQKASPPQRERFSAIAAGAGHSCGLRLDDGTALCWGGSSIHDHSAPEGGAIRRNHRWGLSNMWPPRKRLDSLLGYYGMGKPCTAISYCTWSSHCAQLRRPLLCTQVRWNRRVLEH